MLIVLVSSGDLTIAVLPRLSSPREELSMRLLSGPQYMGGVLETDRISYRRTGRSQLCSGFFEQEQRNRRIVETVLRKRPVNLLRILN
jgi:hypothetical protein